MCNISRTDLKTLDSIPIPLYLKEVLRQPPMTNHDWADNAMRCAGARIKALRPVEYYSWAHYLQQRERETLSALYGLYWASVRRDFESGYSL